MPVRSGQRVAGGMLGAWRKEAWKEGFEVREGHPCHQLVTAVQDELASCSLALLHLLPVSLG